MEPVLTDLHATKHKECYQPLQTPVSRTKRAIKGAIANLIQTTVTTGISFVSVPIMIATLGLETYGLWILLGQLTAYLSLVDFGTAVVAKLDLASMQLEAADEPKVEILTNTLLGVLVTSPLIAIAACALSAGVGIAYESEVLSMTAIVWCAGLQSVAFMLNRPVAVATFALYGANLEYKASNVRNVVASAGALADIAIVLCGLGIFGLAVNRVVIQAALGASIWRTATRNIGWFRFSRFRWKPLPSLFKRNLSCLVYQWGNVFNDSADTVIMGLAIGPTAIPIYSVTSGLPRLLFTIFNQATSATSSGLAGLFGSGNRLQFNKIRTEQTLAVVVWCGLVSAGVILVNHAFVAIWVGEHYYGGTLLTAIALAWLSVSCLSRLLAAFLVYSLELKFMARVQIIGGIFGVLAGFLAGVVLGIPGVLVALTATRIVTSAVNRAHLCNLAGSDKDTESTSIPKAIAVTVVTVSVAILTVLWQPAMSLLEAFTSAFIIVTLGAYSLWKWGLCAADKERLFSRLRLVATLSAPV